MILQSREYRRLLNRFIENGHLDSMVGGGVIMTYDQCPFTVTEKALWHDKTHICNHVIRGRGWRVKLLDTTDGGRGRVITEVVATGDRERARRELLYFLREIY